MIFHSYVSLPEGTSKKIWPFQRVDNDDWAWDVYHFFRGLWKEPQNWLVTGSPSWLSQNPEKLRTPSIVSPLIQDFPYLDAHTWQAMTIYSNKLEILWGYASPPIYGMHIKIDLQRPGSSPGMSPHSHYLYIPLLLSKYYIYNIYIYIYLHTSSIVFPYLLAMDCLLFPRSYMYTYIYIYIYIQANYNNSLTWNKTILR